MFVTERIGCDGYDINGPELNEIKKASGFPTGFFIVSAIDYLFFSNNLGITTQRLKSVTNAPAAAIISM